MNMRMAGGMAALWLLCGAATAETLDARLHWLQRVPLGTPVSGVIAEVTAVAGQRVQKGEVLLRLDARPLQARVTGLEAERIARAHDHDEARRELERTRELYERTLLADRDLTLAKIALSGAEAVLKTAEAQLAQAQWTLQYSRIQAPFDARVVRRNAEPGQTVISNLQAEPLLVVARAGAMLARAMVDGERVARLKPGQAINVSVAGQSYHGSLQRVGLEPEADGRYAVDVQFDTGGQLLRAGLPARIELP
ncbi:MAG TPA: efflux RND transporter periplasmic adaptor subunit [Gammaproteobacteria bacterium]|nr:efflux RND transporter periplasmic adaptor subunit [Gammaproteobacteria bacterium]